MAQAGALKALASSPAVKAAGRSAMDQVVRPAVEEGAKSLASHAAGRLSGALVSRAPKAPPPRTGHQSLPPRSQVTPTPRQDRATMANAGAARVGGGQGPAASKAANAGPASEMGEQLRRLQASQAEQMQFSLVAAELQQRKDMADAVAKMVGASGETAKGIIK